MANPLSGYSDGEYAPVPEPLYLLHERVAIKMDSGIPEAEAERQARAELGVPK